MTSISMGSGYLRPRTQQIHGIPALAIRFGRFLELWGLRVSRPWTGEEVELHLQAQRRAATAIAAREATVNRAWYQGIR